MRIESMMTGQPPFLPSQIKPVGEAKTSFAVSLQDALQKANETIVASEKISGKIATGEITNIHDVTIAAQKAQIALQLTTQVRDKVVEAYQEVMRMQV